jgi:hypothetical protein
MIVNNFLNTQAQRFFSLGFVYYFSTVNKSNESE